MNEGIEGFSPTHRLFLDQDALEPLLRERALELGAQLRNRVEAVGLEQDDDGVTVTLRDLDSDTESTVRARYVVAADGNRSPTRNRLGIGMEGYGLLSRSITIYFRADCAPLLRTATRASSTSTTRRCAGSSGSTGRAARASSSSTPSARTSRRRRR